MKIHELALVLVLTLLPWKRGKEESSCPPPCPPGPEGTLPPGGEQNKALPNIPPVLPGSPPVGSPDLRATSSPQKLIDLAKSRSQGKRMAGCRMETRAPAACPGHALILKRLGAPFLRSIQEVQQHGHYPQTKPQKTHYCALCP